LDESFNTFTEAQQATTQTIEKYNTLRPHGSCDNLTLVKAHEASGILYKRWKTKTENQLLTT